MPDLIAQGPEAQQRWRRPLPGEQSVVVGRSGGVWNAPWDAHVSRRHVRLRWTGRRLEVARLAEGRNPIFFHGAEVDQFTLEPGEHFVIGQTTFTLADQRVEITADVPRPVQQQSFSAQYLKGVQFRNPDRRLEVLSRLPEVISGSPGDAELFTRLVSMILAGVPRADAAAVVAVEGIAEGDDDEPRRPLPVRVLHWDQRTAIGSDFESSEGLIREAAGQGQSVLHVWRGMETSGGGKDFTESEVFDWAFCTAVPEKSCHGWGLYVAGRFSAEDSDATQPSDPTDLREDVKFTELVAAMLGSLRKMRLLERRHASLSQFFSPVVLETLAVEDPELVLAPRQTEVSVLFCDLRGFSRESERGAGDLMELLQRVSRALGVMTNHIRRQGGVVGDFHGDSAMGFWGWPLPQEHAVLGAVTAALAVGADFRAVAQQPDSPLADFRAGIGLATGKAVAGKIGTVDQVKVTVFGPVVNLAARLEGMTKILHAPILLDEPTAEAVRQEVPRTVARTRRLAKVLPYGLTKPLLVNELLPPQSQYPELTDEHIGFYESALDAFLAGSWSEAFELLHQIPTEDRAKDFLTAYIAQRNRTPPGDWDGVIALETKGR